jgi:hypothetical protein
MPPGLEEAKKSDWILENIPKKQSVVIEFFGHSFVS